MSSINFVLFPFRKISKHPLTFDLRYAILYLELILNNSNKTFTKLREVIFMEIKRDYPKSKAILFFIISFVVAYALQFAAMYFYTTQIYTILLGISMFVPMLAVLISHKGLGNAKTGINWKLNFKRNWKWFLAAWICPAIFTAIGGALYYLIFPDKLDMNFGYLASVIPEGADMQGMTIPMLVGVQAVTAVTYAPIINMLPALGEEAGWRGYMTPMLTAKIGRKPALVLGGIIWGAWHWPAIIFSGHNYGTGYWGEPFTGMLMMCVSCVILGIALSYLYDKSKCIWLPAIAHGAINAIGTIPILFSDGSIESGLLGPAPTGLITIAPLGIIALIIFFAHKNKENSAVENQ